jgi:hypothetical protein
MVALELQTLVAVAVLQVFKQQQVQAVQAVQVSL